MGTKTKKEFLHERFFSGLLDLAKCRYISEAVSDHGLDFISVMETGKQDMSNKNLSRFCGGADCSFKDKTGYTPYVSPSN